MPRAGGGVPVLERRDVIVRVLEPMVEAGLSLLFYI
jgi:hypothetical protein